MRFKDYFSGHAQEYSEFRPSYPETMYRWLSDQCLQHDCAWDCATGNGQAAVALTEYFMEVYATDASAEQINNAIERPKIRYRVAHAEQCGLQGRSIDLVTVAQALHWFDHNKFYAEVNRVLKPGGLFAAWTYELPVISTAVDAVVWRLYEDITGAYWSPERALVDDGYRSLAFPFREVTVPQFSMTLNWNLQQYMGYLGTWSAVHKYHADKGQHPLDLVSVQLEEAWGDPGKIKCIVWVLHVRAGFREVTGY